MDSSTNKARRNINDRLLLLNKFCKSGRSSFLGTSAKAPLRLREIDLLRGHSSILEKFSYIPTRDFCKTQDINLNKSFVTAFLSKEEWGNVLIVRENDKNIYTDGSKLNNKVDGGVYSEKLGVSQLFRLPDHCRVFQAEVTVIKERLTAIK